jgi:hypothetical protein
VLEITYVYYLQWIVMLYNNYTVKLIMCDWMTCVVTVTSTLSRENSRMLNYSYVCSVMTDGIIYYIHMRELGMLCFWFLCFVGFIINVYRI